jgi:hypothetical protein
MNTPTRGLAALLALAFVAAGAQAAQKTTTKCNATGPGGGNLVSLTTASGQVPLNDLSIKLNNTTGANKVATLWFSADAGIDPNAELRLVWQVDGASGAYLGPQNLANHTDFWMTRSAIATYSVPPGVHTIVPAVFISGTPGMNANVDDRCIVVTF